MSVLNYGETIVRYSAGISDHRTSLDAGSDKGDQMLEYLKVTRNNILCHRMMRLHYISILHGAIFSHMKHILSSGIPSILFNKNEIHLITWFWYISRFEKPSLTYAAVSVLPMSMKCSGTGCNTGRTL